MQRNKRNMNNKYIKNKISTRYYCSTWSMKYSWSCPIPRIRINSQINTSQCIHFLKPCNSLPILCHPISCIMFNLYHTIVDHVISQIINIMYYISCHESCGLCLFDVTYKPCLDLFLVTHHKASELPNDNLIQTYFQPRIRTRNQICEKVLNK